MADENDRTPHQQAESYFQATQLLTRELEQKFQNIKGVLQKDERETRLEQSFVRCVAWMQSLSLLSGARHIQAMVAAERALIEITIDVLFLHHDTTLERTERQRVWEISAKLKSCERAVSFFVESHNPIPSEYAVQETFINNRKASINQERVRLGWVKRGTNNPRHPDRWTDNDLSVDVKEADLLLSTHSPRKLGGVDIKSELGVSLEQIYRTEYTRMNWLVHGSGLLFVIDSTPDQISLLARITLGRCIDLSFLCLKVLLTDFRIAEALENFDERWRGLRLQILDVASGEISLRLQEEIDGSSS